MRYKKSKLIARRNKVLPIKFVKQDMATFSGLTFIDHFLRLYGIHRRIKGSLSSYKFKGDYNIGDILYVLLISLFVGAERLRHLDYLKNDPLFCRIVRLTRIQPSHPDPAVSSGSSRAVECPRARFLADNRAHSGSERIESRV